MSNQADRDSSSDIRPFDFAFRFDYKSGDDSSPELVQYVIEVAPDGSGEFHYQDDEKFKSDDFVALFYPSNEDVGHVYHLMSKYGILQSTWQPPRSPQRTDEFVAKLEVTCGGICFETQTPQNKYEVDRLEPVFAAIRALVPQATWQKVQ